MNKKIIKWGTAIIGICLLIALVVVALWKNNTATDQITEKRKEEEQITAILPEEPSNEYNEDSEIENVQETPLETIEITSIQSYDGPFFEDGSDDLVENVLMITVKNNGQQTLQYAEATLSFGNTTAQFAFSTLKPGESMAVLEKNRLEYPGEMEPDFYQFENVIFFPEEPGLFSDKVEISALDGAFNVRNISGEDLTGNIAIYYKNKLDQGYLGGITYRTVIRDGMAKDEIKQLVANHFREDQSQIVFVEFTELE